MFKLTTAALALSLVSPAFGQASSAFTTPPGYLTTEGTNIGTTSSGYSYYFGRYANGHYQVADGEIKAMGVKILNSVGFRLDYRSHSTGTAQARKWSNVTLSLAACDFTKMTRTYSTNAIGTVTTVYSAGTSWPAQTGNPRSERGLCRLTLAVDASVS